MRNFRMARSRIPLLFDLSVGDGPRKPSDAQLHAKAFYSPCLGQNLLELPCKFLIPPTAAFFARETKAARSYPPQPDHPNCVGTPGPCIRGGVAIGMQRAEMPRPTNVGGKRRDCPETRFCITRGSDAVAGPVNLQFAFPLLLPLPTPWHAPEIRNGQARFLRSAPTLFAIRTYNAVVPKQQIKLLHLIQPLEPRQSMQSSVSSRSAHRTPAPLRTEIWTHLCF